MKLNDYQNKAMSTCMDSSRNMSYMAMGLTSEVGEFMGKIAKAIRKGDVYIGTDAKKSDLHYSESFLDDCYRCYQWETDLKHELGDVLWFAAGIAEVMGWTLEDVAQENIYKLASRQRRGVIDGNGDNR